MTEPATSQDNFSFRLAQWLLDQFDSHGALDTTSNQLTNLISQEQSDSRTNLSVHIGELIFKKATRHPTDDLAQLCTRLCHSIFLQDIKRDSSFSGKSVHDWTFQLCVGSLEATNLEQQDGSGVVSLSHISTLVAELYKYGLISLAHVYAYLRCLTTSNGPLESRLLGLCTILEAAGSALNFGPWKAETESVMQWANGTVEKSPVDEYVKDRIKTITSVQIGSQGRQSYSEPGLQVEEQGPLGPAASEQYTSNTANPPIQSQASNDAVASHQAVSPERGRVEQNESSASEGTLPGPAKLSEADAQTSNSREDGRPSGSASPAQSIVDDETLNRNNYGHHTVAHDGEIQSSESVASPRQLATTTPAQAATSAVPSRGPGGSGFEPSNPARPATPTASSTPAASPAKSRRQSTRRPAAGQPAVKLPRLWGTVGLWHRSAAGSIIFGTIDSAPEKNPEPAQAPAPDTVTPAPKPTNDINIVAPTPSAVAPKPATPAALSTSPSPSATPDLKQKKLNVHALFQGGGLPAPTVTTTVQQQWPGYYPPHGYYDPYMYWQHQQYPHHQYPHQQYPDQPRLDHPRPDQPRLDRPRPGQPRLEQPRPDQPRLDQPRPDQPRLDRPRPDRPRLDQPRPDQPHPLQHDMPQIHTPPMEPTPHAQPAEGKSKEEKRKAKKAKRKAMKEEERKAKEEAERKAKEEEERRIKEWEESSAKEAGERGIRKTRARGQRGGRLKRKSSRASI